MDRLGVRNPRGLAAFAVVAGGMVTMAGAGVSGAGGVFVGAAVAGVGGDLALQRCAPGLIGRLGRLHIGETLRFELRCVLLLLLLGRIHVTGPIGLASAMALVLCLLGGQALHAAICTLIRRRRRLAVAARHVDLRRLGISDRPPRRLTEWPGLRMLVYEVSALAGLGATLVTGDARWVVAGLTLAAGGCAVTVLALLPYLVRSLRLPGPARVLAEVNAWLGRHRPETVLYFSGPRESAYQVGMWLETLAALRAPALVILRERHLLEGLAPTALPVLCVPDATHLRRLDLGSVRVALYPANVGENIHLLRVPTMQHVFLGDGDTTAGVDPYSKVYDQVWVAGRAGRQRYAEAAVGVEDADIVEVGRPQLDGVRVREDDDRAPAAIPTVLLTAGDESLVRRLLESEPPVRVLYRPHPATGGRRSAAHRRIAAAISAANERRAGREADEPEDARALRAEAARCRTELTRRIAAHQARLRRAHADEAMLTRDSAAPDPAPPEEARELSEQWHRAHWAASPPWSHQIIEADTANAPDLRSCFDQADLLIGDPSGVVSDFIATLKPYALVDTAGLGAQEFRRRHTVAHAAYLLGPEDAGVDDLLRLLFNPAGDSLRAARHELRAYLLGPMTPPSIQRFDEAVDALAAKGEALNRLRELQTIREGAPDEHQPAAPCSCAPSAPPPAK
ncbi:hypothetical protein ACFZCY_31555 [Streptomyces sp. NPDC007983]|uniref:hypothetical protein n=1 Tax=Streptomyces sp. NPDC007983 TaxID=3364800 RepID=UPI0036F16DE4